MSLDAAPVKPASKKLFLISKERIKYAVSRRAAISSSALIKSMLEHDDKAGEIDLAKIDGPIMQKVVQYMEYHLHVPPIEIEKPLRSTNLQELVDPWDADFADTKQEDIFKLMLVANYLDMKSLCALMCAKVASLMKDKNPEEIRRVFNIRSDYTAEEEEEVMSAHADLLDF